ncbi:MAG: hypothetical protein ACFCBU_00645 [Cyanophyceae cyanobacterium]
MDFGRGLWVHGSHLQPTPDGNPQQSTTLTLQGIHHGEFLVSLDTNARNCHP